jgi:hypothetical protein
LKTGPTDNSYFVSYYIFDNENIFTIEYVDLYVENYFTIVAGNQYGTSEPVTITYGGDDYSPVMLMSSSLETVALEAFVGGNNLSLNFKTTTGIAVDSKMNNIEIYNLSNPLSVLRFNEYLPETSINISGLPAGLYAVKVFDVKGKSYSTKFVVK